MNRANGRTDETCVMTPPDPRAPAEFRLGTAPALIPGAGRPNWFQWIALAALPVAMIAIGLIRIACGDIAWHLATARVASATGLWPVTNLFSHTWPGYALYQQYPVFQSCVYFIQ